MRVAMARGATTRTNWATVADSDFDRALVQSTIDSALASSRLRAHATLPNGEDGWHRTLIAMTQNSYVPPHFHPATEVARGERLVCVRGRCAVLLFASGDADCEHGDASPLPSLRALAAVAIVYLAPEHGDLCVIRSVSNASDGAEVPSAVTARAVEIEPGVAHSVVSLADIAIMCESKTAADFAANRKLVLPNFPGESDPDVHQMLSTWRREIAQRCSVL